MSDREFAARTLAPWLQGLAQLESWLADGGHSTRRADALEGLRAVLEALSRAEEGLPRDIPAGPSTGAPSLDHWLRPDHVHAADELKRKRQDVLRLALWRVLRVWRDAVPESSPAPRLAALHRSFAGRDLAVPPGLGPSLAYATSPLAPEFFNERLRQALRGLGARCDAAGADYAGLAGKAPFEPTGADVHAWSRAWTAAVAGVYLDWLDQQNEGRVEQAMRSLWRDGSAQVCFRAVRSLAALPSRDRSIHLDLWVDVVLAQALEHAPARWKAAAAGRRWHRLQLALHDLGQQTRGSRTRREQRTVYRGLGVEMLYQAVFIHRVEEVLKMRPTDTGLSPPAAAPVVDVFLQTPRPGHEASFNLVIHWQRGAEAPPDRRFSGTDAAAPSTATLNPPQQAAFRRWQLQRAAQGPQRLPTHALAWRPAGDEDEFHDDAGAPLHALGQGALWSCLGVSAHWLDLALMVFHGGAWQDLPLRQHDEAGGDEARTWLLVDATPPPWCDATDWPRAVRRIGAALNSDAAACWVLRHAGVGAFVLAAVDLDHT